MADTESLITEWETSGNTTQTVAARIARKIAGKNRYDEPPINSALAAEYDVSERTVTAAKSILRDNGILILENRRYYVALSPQPPDIRKTEEAPRMQESPPPLAPRDPSGPYALRMTLIRRYSHLNLKFSTPIVSESGKHEASWIGGNAAADTEAALLEKVLEAMGDCGSDGHLWESRSEKRDPLNNDNVLLTQTLTCVFCDERERVIPVYHPHPTVAEESTPQERKDNGTPPRQDRASQDQAGNKGHQSTHPFLGLA
jgi:hypothetical protein